MGRGYRLCAFAVFASVSCAHPVAAADAVTIKSADLSTYFPLPGSKVTATLRLNQLPVARAGGVRADLALIKNGSNILVRVLHPNLNPAQASGEVEIVQQIDIPVGIERGDYRLELKLSDKKSGRLFYENKSVSGFIVSGAASPLGYSTVRALSSFDMLESMGVGIGISYQLAPDYPNRPWDISNRDGEKEAIAALKYLGLHHVRNEGLDDNPLENADRPAPGKDAPSDFENFLTLRAAIPELKLNYLVQGANKHWGDGSAGDPRPVLLKLAKAGALSAIEGPNEPNFQCVMSPTGTAYVPCAGGADYAQNMYRFNQIWSDWGRALSGLKHSDPAFATVPLLTPSIGAWGPNGPDGVEGFYAKSGLNDHSELYDVMNIHAYGPSGLSLGDPQGDIRFGNAPNWAAYQLSVPNWGRYAMPGKPVIITESGASSRKLPKPAASASEFAQGVALLNNYFWAKYYGAQRLYQYTLVDDSTDPKDDRSERWGFFRGDWSAKPAADFVHRFSQAVFDNSQSDFSKIPAFNAAGPQVSTWGTTMALSKSDGGYIIICNNVLPRWDVKTGQDIEPKGERWTLRLPSASHYSIVDVVRNETSPEQIGDLISLDVKGYPLLVIVRPGG